jgi:hypothetical protein
VKQQGLTKINSLEELKQLKEETVIITISERGILTLTVTVNIKQEFKTFLLRIDNQILQQIDRSSFDFETLDYFNITVHIFDSAGKMAYLIYYLRDLGMLQQLEGVLGVSQTLFEEKIGTVVTLFRSFKEEKIIVKTIKFKAEIININEAPHRW